MSKSLDIFMRTWAVMISLAIELSFSRGVPLAGWGCPILEISVIMGHAYLAPI